MDAFLAFLIKHNVIIIEVLFGLILLTGLVMLVRAFLRSESHMSQLGLSSTSAELSQLEAHIKALLEQNLQNSSHPVVSGDASEVQVKLQAEVDKGQKEIQSLKKALEEAKAAQEAQGAAAPAESGLSSEEKTRLEAKLNELQAKLSEYEIISEDIADLSRFREENSKLKDRIKELESQPAAVPAPAVAPVQAAPPPPPPVEPPKTPAAPPPPPPPAPAAPAPSEGSVVDDDLLAEFAKAVEEQKGSGPTPAGGSAAPVASAENPIEASIDLEKVGSEASQLASESGAPEVNSLSQSLDADKLLKEAKNMEEEKNLMGQFEQFAGKEQG